MRQCNCPLNQFIIGIIVAVFFTGESIAQENTDWRDRFFAEAPKRWEDYVRFARSLQISLTANQYRVADRSPIESYRLEIKQSKGAFLGFKQDLGPKGEAEALGNNPSYAFKVKRRGPDRGWIIADLDVSDQSTTLSDKQSKLQEKLLHKVCDCLKLESLWLPTLIHDPDFKITAIKTQEIAGRPVIRFDFDYPKPDKDFPNIGGLRVKGGWMVLDPEHDWIMREYMVHTGRPEKNYIRHTFQIREGTDRHPIITHQTEQSVKIVNKGEKPSFETEEEWQAVERSDVPLEEFTLSAFGLPEPPRTQVGRSRWYLWIALGGIVCLGVSALIRWASRRARAAG